MKSVYFIVTLQLALTYGQETGPVGNIKFYQMKDCSNPVNKINLERKISTDANKIDSLSASFDLHKDLEYKNILISVNADKRVGGDLEKDAYVFTNRPLIPFLESFMPTVLKNFREKVSPKMSAADRIPAGHYTIDKFRAKIGEIKTPQVPYGDFEVDVTLKNAGEELFCLRADLSFFKPEIPKIH